MITNSKSGFTVVELLVTLFIAAAFLATGYQLYGAIIKDAGQTRALARANNIAYDYLKRYESSATNPCTSLNPLSNLTVSVSGISASTISINISCPYAGAPNVSKVTATLKYNNPQKTTSISSYTNTDTLDLESGLVGWWPLNGNANDNSANGNNGTIIGATPTTGQNGLTNNAYSFDGVGNYINCGNLGNLPSQGTISFWMKAVVVENYRNAFTTDYNGLNNAIRFEEYTTPSPLGGFSAAIGNASSSNAQVYLTSTVLSPNTWYHVVLVWDKNINNVIGYLDNVQKFNTSQTSWPTTMPAVTIGYGFTTTRYWKGSMDDVRIYNRALTATDVQALYSLGAY